MYLSLGNLDNPSTHYSKGESPSVDRLSPGPTNIRFASSTLAPFSITKSRDP